MSPSDKPTLLSLAFMPLPTPQHLAMHRAGTGILALEQREEDPLAQSGDAPTLLASVLSSGSLPHCTPALFLLMFETPAA